MSEKLNIFTDTGCPSLELLTGYLDDRLPLSQRQQLERHMLDCPMCADALEGLESVEDRRRLSGTVLRIRTESKRRLYEQNPYREKSSKRRYRAIPRHFTQYAASAAAAIFILWMGVFIYRDLNQAQSVYDKHFQTEATSPVPFQQPPVADTLHTGALESTSGGPLASAQPAVLPQRTESQTQERARSSVAATESLRLADEPEADAAVPANLSGPEEAAARDDRREMPASARPATGEANKPLPATQAPDAEKKQAPAAREINQAGRANAAAPAPDRSEAIANYTQAPGYQPQIAYQDAEMTLGLQSFEKKNYVQALAAFEQVLTRFPDYTEAQYLAARSHIEMGKPEKAISLLKAVISSGDATYYHEAQWQLSGAYLLRNKKQPAVKLLRQIEQEDGPYQEKARAALKDL